MLSAIAYVPIGFILPLISKPKSKFCQMHAKQGMVLSVLTFFILFVLVLIPAIGSLLFLGLIAAIGIGAFQAYSGLDWNVPVLTDVASKINVDSIFGAPMAPTSHKTPTAEPTASTPAPAETPAPVTAPEPPAPAETPAEPEPPKS